MKTFVFTLFCCALSGVVQAITVSNYSDAANDRFTNDGTFIGADYNFSGVGRSTSTTSTKWATLIGSNYFISANHYHPGVGTDIEFYSGNSEAGASYTYTVAGGYNVSGTDFWIGYTTDAIQPSLARYTFTTTLADTLAQTGLSGSMLLTSGDRVTGQPGSPTEHTVGTNYAESFMNQGDTTLSTPQATVNLGSAVVFDQIVTYMNLPGDNTLNVSTYESQLAAGDSGSPLFMTSGNELILVGTAYAISSVPIPGNFIDTSGPAGGVNDPYESRDASFFSYIGSYETQINNTIALIPTPVPEPSVALLSLAAAGMLLRRKRA